jgi:hypothetical protein
MSYSSVSHCGNDHLQWLKSIDFYNDDLDTLEKRLLEIIRKNNTQEAMAGVEHFQNQFIVQRHNIDKLRHSIHDHSGRVALDVQDHEGQIDTVLVGEHDEIKGEFESFEKVMNDLRHEYNLFLAKWM